MLNLDMRQLEYFVTAASAGSYASAAKKLFVSPQAISKGVQVLERNMGVALFERGPNGIALTSFGETFYRESKTVLESLERLQSMADRYQREHAASLSVGIHSLCFKEHGGSIDWNDLLEFHDAHKNIDPSFVEMRGDSIVAGLAIGNPLSDPGGITMEKMSSLKIAFDTQPLWKRGEEAVLEILKRSGFEITHTWSHGSSKMNLVEKDFTRGFTTWKIVANNVGYLYEDSFDIIPIIGHDTTLYAWAVYRKDNPNPQVSKFAESWQAIAKAREGAD